jgi:hypothetical protein
LRSASPCSFDSARDKLRKDGKAFETVEKLQQICLYGIEHICKLLIFRLSREIKRDAKDFFNSLISFRHRYVSINYQGVSHANQEAPLRQPASIRLASNSTEDAD